MTSTLNGKPIKSGDDIPVVFKSISSDGYTYYVDGKTFVNYEYCKSIALTYRENMYQCQPGQTIVAEKDHGWRCEGTPMSTSHAVLLGSGMICTAILGVAFLKWLLGTPTPTRARK